MTAAYYRNPAHMFPSDFRTSRRSIHACICQCICIVYTYIYVYIYMYMYVRMYTLASSGSCGIWIMHRGGLLQSRSRTLVSIFIPRHVCSSQPLAVAVYITRLITTC